jgi:hypothetical protein
MYRHYVPTKRLIMRKASVKVLTTTLLSSMHQAYYQQQTNSNTCLDPRSQNKVISVTKLLRSVWYSLSSNLSHKLYQTVWG